MKNLNELAAQVHAANHQWWHDIHTGEPLQRNRGELLMLVITELAEAVEGIRKNLMDDKLPHRRMEEVEMADAVIRLLDFAGGFKQDLHDFPDAMLRPDGVDGNKGEDILGMCRDVISIWENSPDDVGMDISVLVLGIRSYCYRHNLDLEGAIAEKMAYNLTRKDHSIEARKADGGKKF